MNKKRVPWLVSLWLLAAASPLIAQQSKPAQSTKQPNIVIIWGDDIGQTDVSAYSMGLMGFHTPNIDRVAKEGMIFTDYYAEQELHGRPGVVHHRPIGFAHRLNEGRLARR